MRSLFNLMNGLIKSMDAPVVPMILEKTAPINNMTTFIIGFPFLSILMRIPPEATNKPVSREINWTYSKKAWTGA